MTARSILAVAAAIALSPVAEAATSYVNLGGPATGFLAISNLKNSATRNGIEGKDTNGNPVAGHNGLPDYPNYQIPAGYTNAGNYTAVVVSPQTTTADYASAFAGFYGGSSLTVNNQTVADANSSTMSAGLIGYDDTLVTGAGTETIPVSALTFNFDTYQWDGKTGGDNAGWTVGGVTPPFAISPFSSVHTDYNDGTGAGNASAIYNISIANVTGSGLTFQNGVLTSMDISGDLSVLLRLGNLFIDPPMSIASANFTGTFTASGLNYGFDVRGTRSVAIFSGINLVMNRAGTASVIPEPSSFFLASFAALGLLARRRRA